jgi:hypothetical protein
MEFEIEIDVYGNLKQLEAIKYWTDNSVIDILYGGSKGSGKSYLGCSLIFGDALMYPETNYFIARKRIGDLNKYTTPSIQEVLTAYGLDKRYYKFNASSSVYTLYNGSKIFLIEAKYMPSDPMYQRFGSMQMTRGWIEEAGEFEVEAKNNLLATVGRWNNDKYGINGKILQTCNPSKNYLYPNYYKKSKEGTLEKHIRYIQALPTDNKMIASGYLEMLNKTLSHSEKERLLNGNWEYDDDPNTLCNYDDICQIFENDHVPEGKYYLTGDIARMGSDKAVIIVWSGWVAKEIIIFEKSKMTELQNVIQSLRTKYQISKQNCIVDEDGIGGGIVDNSGVKGFVNNSVALNGENYVNLQSQCCFGLAEKINLSQIYIECEIAEKYKEEIIQELEYLKTYKLDAGGKLRILPKADIKQALGRSPDFRDALMMRYYYELAPNFTAPKSRIITRN